MNETNWNEKRLRVWRPRRVSDKVKRHLFDARLTDGDGAGAPHPHDAKWFWSRLAPTAACALLTLMTVNHGGDAPGQKTSLSLAMFAPDEILSAQNHVAAVTFDSTNHSLFNSNIRFTQTNTFSNE